MPNTNKQKTLFTLKRSNFVNQFFKQLFYKNTKTLHANTHTLTKMSNNNQVELAFLNQEELQN